LEQLVLERNELQFLSLWSKRKLSRRLTLLYNPNLSDDFLFNHARTTDPEETLNHRDLTYIKKFYTRLKMKPTLILHSKLDSSQKRLLSGEGFKAVDRLITMSAPTRISSTLEPNLKISACGEADLAEWVKVFIEAFSTPSWLKELNRIAANMVKHPSCTLYLARYKGAAVGVAVRYSIERVSGLYCLGIKPSFRNKGVGSALVAHVISEAYRSGDQIICLQSLASEHLTRFYTRLGFKHRYSKAVYSSEATI
jgi:GNAT superfamily N-acetyltransferase